MPQQRIPDKIGKYEIGGVVGKGAMGVVYRAVDPLLGREVAIKTLSVTATGDEAELRLRFLREAQAAGKLQHQNIITVHELFQEDDTAFLVMELLDGASLSTLLRRNGDLSLGQKLSIVDQIASGLSEAHGHRIVHRDLKPSNVFVLGTGVVKVLDFGVAKIGDGELTKEGDVVGTVEYMAPEQVRGEAVSRQADIFALGVVAYELVSGGNPFRASSLASSVFKILSEQPARLPPERVPEPIQAVIFGALSKPLVGRFGTLEQMRGELRDACKSSGMTLEQPVGVTATVSDPSHDDERTVGLADVSSKDEADSHAERLADAFRKGLEAARRGEHESCVETMGMVLDAEPNHAQALECLASSEEKLREGRVSPTAKHRAEELLSSIRQAYQRGDARAVMEEVKEVLAIDDASVEARWYRRSAEALLSRPPGSVPKSQPTIKKPRRIIVTTPAPPPARRNTWAWALAGAALIVAATAVLWAVGSSEQSPVVSAKPAEMPGVRRSPFESIDDDGTVVLQLSQPAADSASRPSGGPKLRYILPTTIRAGERTTLGLFGEGFADGASVRVDDRLGQILAVKVHDSGHIEVSLSAVDGTRTLELIVDNGDGHVSAHSVEVSP